MNAKYRRTMIFAVCLLPTLLLMSGCARKIVDDDDGINVSVRLDYKMVSPGGVGAIDHFELLIEGADFGSIIVPMLLEDGMIVAEAVVPAGKNRRFVASALDRNNIVLYRGETTADIAKGQILILDIDMFPVVPMLNITPHYQYFQMNDTFYVDISVFNVPHITSITFDFKHNDAPIYLMNVVKGEAYGDTVGIYYGYSDNYNTYFIEVYHTNETGTIVDESGYAHLATVALGSYRDWATDTATVIMQVQPTYIYSYPNASIPVDSIHTDGARVELYVPDSAVVSTWEKVIGGAGDDIGYSTCRAHNGNLIIAGSTGSAGSEDVYLAAVDLEGNMQWEKTFGGNAADIGYCVIPTVDGGYLICGSSESFASDDFPPDLYLIKTDAAGNAAWEKTYGVGAMESGLSVARTPGGGYIIAGQASLPGGSSIYLVKTDAQGDSIWTGTYNINEFDGGRSVMIASDGNYVIAGGTSGFDYPDNVCLLFVNPDGGLIRQMTHGGAAFDAGNDISPAFDGGYIIVGYSNSSGAGLNDLYVVKTNSVGQFSWSKTYGFSGNDYGYSIAPTRDQGYILAGCTQAVGSPAHDIYLIKTRSNGSAAWYSIFGGAGDDIGYAVARTSDGGYLVVGSTDSFGAGGKDIYLLKTDADGHIAPSAFSNHTGLIKRYDD